MHTTDDVVVDIPEEGRGAFCATWTRLWSQPSDTIYPNVADAAGNVAAGDVREAVSHFDGKGLNDTVG